MSHAELIVHSIKEGFAIGIEIQVNLFSRYSGKFGEHRSNHPSGCKEPPSCQTLHLRSSLSLGGGKLNSSEIPQTCCDQEDATLITRLRKILHSAA